MGCEFIENDEFFKNYDERYSRDSLTKVYNRETILEYVKDLLRRHIHFSMILLDMDNFKYVNDKYGHLVGDKVLVSCAEEILKSTKDFGVVGRYGGDEFIIVVPLVSDYDDIWKKCRDITFSAKNIVVDELKGNSLSFTLGLSRSPVDGDDFEILMEKADKALYRGKQKGRNCFIIYLDEKHANIDRTDSGKALFSSMDMHYRIFSTLTSGSDMKDNILTMLNFFSSSLMFDHICIQAGDEICTSVIYPISPVKSFYSIPKELLDRWTNINGLCYINNILQIAELKDNELLTCLEEQKIAGTAFVGIDAYGKRYGYLRADSANSNGRIWQNGELDLLITFALALGILLHDNNCTLEEIFDI